MRARAGRAYEWMVKAFNRHYINSHGKKDDEYKLHSTAQRDALARGGSTRSTSSRTCVPAALATLATLAALAALALSASTAASAAAAASATAPAPLGMALPRVAVAALTRTRSEYALRIDRSVSLDLVVGVGFRS